MLALTSLLLLLLIVVLLEADAQDGIISTIAGAGSTGSTGDGGPATSALLYNPEGVSLDVTGNVYIADTSNHKIRKVTGIITTIAGTGTAGSTGDGGPATSALLYNPYGTSVDVTGNVYIAGTGNNKIRKVTVSTGIITTIAGTGSFGSTGDGGPATSALLYNPEGVSLDVTGNVYIADTSNHKIRKVTVSTGIITTIAGTGSFGSTGDGGPATSALLYNPYGVSVDVTGNVYIADSNNHKIRKVTYSTMFHTYLVQRRCIIGSRALLYPNGINATLWGCKVLSLPTGILYLSNNEPFFGCIISAKGSRMRRNGRLIVYTMNNTMTFFLYSISDAIFNYLQVPQSASKAFNFCVIAPASVTIVWVFTSLYACTCIDSSTFKSSSLYGYEDVFRIIGRLVLVPLSLLCFGLLVLSAIFSRGHSQIVILASALDVILATIALNIVRAILAFVSSFHVGIYVFFTPHRAVTGLNIGALYCERIHRSYDTVKEDVDYRHVRMQVMNVLIDVVVPMEYAIRLGIDRRKATPAGVVVPVVPACDSHTYSSSDDSCAGVDVELSSIYVGSARSVDVYRTTAADRLAIIDKCDGYSVEGGHSVANDDVSGINYADIYACTGTSSSKACDTSESDTTASADAWIANPLHMIATDDASHASSAAAPQYPMQTTPGVTSTQTSSLSQHTRDVMLQQKVIHAYQLPNRIRNKRGSFISAYIHIDTFVLSRKNKGVRDATATATTVSDVDTGIGRDVDTAVDTTGANVN